MEVLAEFTKGSVTRLKQWKENGIPEWNIGFIDGKVRLEDLPPKPSKVELMFTLETSVMLPRTSEDLQKLGSYGIAFKSSNLSCYDASYRNGIWIKWHKNGQINIEANYDSGIQSGIMTAWNTKGVPYMKKYYHDDGGYTKKYYENGQIKYEDNWKNGKIGTRTERRPWKQTKDGIEGLRQRAERNQLARERREGHGSKLQRRHGRWA